MDATSAPLTQQDEAQLRRRLLSPERLRQLTQPRPVRVMLDTAGCWLVILAAWTWVALMPRWWVVALAIPIIGTRSYALFIIAHDGLHRRLFPTVTASDRFNDWCVVGSFGAVTRLHNRNHLSHHQNLATPVDPDRYKYSCLNKTTASQLWFYLLGGHVLTSIWNVLFKRSSVVGQGTRVDRPSARWHELAVLLGWQAALWTGGVLAIGWWAVPVLWYLPFFLFALLADNLRTFCEHTQLEEDDAADRHRLVTFVSNPLERLFVAPMHMNFHAAHHLWPGIPYPNLPIADREMRQHPDAALLEWRGSYFGFVRRYLRALPIAGCTAGQRAP